MHPLPLFATICNDMQPSANISTMMPYVNDYNEKQTARIGFN